MGTISPRHGMVDPVFNVAPRPFYFVFGCGSASNANSGAIPDKSLQ